MPVLENLRLATPYSTLWTQLLQSDPIDGHLNAETVKEKIIQNADCYRKINMLY